MISIWHPTFLTLLLRPVTEWLGQLTDDIATGRITPPNAISAELGRQLGSAMRPDPARAREIEDCFGSASHMGEASPRLWPRLRLVSCWADGNARSYLPALTSPLPRCNIPTQGAGVNRGNSLDPYAWTVRRRASHAFSLLEFLPQDAGSGETTVLAHELEHGGRYSVVMTTGGGLYRYNTGDLVDVIGYVDSCPLLEFVGKDSHVSDRFGEKLNGMHVQRALDSALASHDISPEFAMVAFDDSAGSPAYALFVESNHASDQALLSLGAEVEEALLENYHYGYCRDLGQLGALRVFSY